MGTTASSLPYSIDNQVGAPHDNNGWAVHNGKSTDGTDRQVTVFVGKKPALAKTPCSQRYPSQTQLQPALHHFQYCKRLRHPQILTVHATLDTDNPSSATMDGGSGGPGRPSAPSSSTSSNATTGDLIVVTEPCVSLNQWLLGNPTPEQLAWGLQCVVEALSFLHTSANLSHGAVSPTSFYVTPSGDVKLWNFALVTPVGPNNVGPNPHFEQYDQACCAETYRSPERVQKQYGTTIANGGVHAMDAFSLGVLIDYWYSQAGRGGLPQQLVKAVQRLQSPNPKMRPRKLQSLLTCPVFDTPYQKMQLQLQEIQIQPVEQKVALWQQLGLDFQNQGGGSSNHQKIPKDVALHKILPLVVTECQTITNNESLLAQDMYRREVLAMLVPLFYIMENYQDPSKIGKDLGPLVSKLFTVPDRGVRSILLNQVGFMTKHMDKAALNAKVFEPLCSGFNDSSPVLRELTLKATLTLVPTLNPPNMEKLSRYLVRLQGDTETTIRTNAVIFIAKIAPHLSDVSKEKMLLPAYARAMKDTFAPCRLSALQSCLQSKSLFTMTDLASKVLPSVTPLTLDPVVDVRKEAFKVIQNMLQDLQQESSKMEQRSQAQQMQQQQQSAGGQHLTGPSVTTPAAAVGTGVAPAPTSGGYMSSLSSWMASSTQPAPATTTAATTAARAPPAIPARQQPVVGLTQQVAATSLSSTNGATASAAVTDDVGWGDDDDGWGDDDDIQDDDPFANIGTKKTSASNTAAPAALTKTFNNDDPFATIGMTTAVGGPRAGGGKLVMPKKPVLGAKKLVTPPATKLQISKDEEVEDGWDDF